MRGYDRKIWMMRTSITLDAEQNSGLDEMHCEAIIEGFYKKASSSWYKSLMLSTAQLWGSKLHLVLCRLATTTLGSTLLRLGIPFRGRQTKWSYHEPPSTDGKRQIITQRLFQTHSSPSSLVYHRQFMHLEHTMRTFLKRGRRARGGE